jgi:hypothetical protein
MINADILKKLIIENKEFISKIEVFNRNIVFDDAGNYVFVGPRRSGKTFLMYQIIKKIIGMEDEYLFINFEDERLIEFQACDFDLLLEAHKQLYTKTPVVFLDELQNIEGWEKFCRRLSDTGYKVYITGSNAKMLSSDIATTLGGRLLLKEIQTLSFSEFLGFNGVVLQEHFEYSQQKTDIVRHQEEYMRNGGLPESIKYTDKRSYLSNIFQKVFFGDIIARYKLKNDFALKLLIKKIAESVNNETSFNRLKNIIKSTGLQVGTSTLIEYFSYMEESFLIFSISNYTSSFSEKESKKKFYFSDTGILNLFLINQESKLLENMVYLELRRRYGSELFFFKRNLETDFYVPQDNLLIQVSYSIRDFATKEREVKALLQAMHELEVVSGTIITFDESETIKKENSTITVLPYWKWVLT